MTTNDVWLLKVGDKFVVRSVDTMQDIKRCGSKPEALHFIKTFGYRLTSDTTGHL
jgi:hypothetical protein